MSAYLKGEPGCSDCIDGRCTMNCSNAELIMEADYSAKLLDEIDALRARLKRVAMMIQSSNGDEELLTMAYREASELEA